MLATTAVAAAGEAVAAAPRFEAVPYFARISADRVVVAFTLNQPAGTRLVIVSGFVAKANAVGPSSSHHYQAFVVGPRLRPGRRHWVRIRVCARGECTTRVERLFLHRRFTGKR